MTGKTRFLSVTTIGLGLSLLLWYRGDKPHGATATSETLSPNATQQENHSTKKTTLAPNRVGPGNVVDPKEWMEHGPKEPLVPREIHVDAELAPGSRFTAEPLVPREVHVDAELAPGSSPTLTPLTPREIKTEMPLP